MFELEWGGFLLLKSLLGYLRNDSELYIIYIVWVILFIGGVIMSVVWGIEKLTQSYYPPSSPKIHFFRYPHPPGIVEWVMEVDGSNKRVVFESDEELIEKETKIYSPDSNIYLSPIPTMNDSDLFLHDYVNSDFVNMTRGEGIEGDFQFSPNGKNLIYMSDREGMWNIYSYHIISGTTTTLTNPEFGGMYPNFTPDGRKIVDVQDRQNPYFSKYTPFDFNDLPDPSFDFSIDDITDRISGQPIKPDTLLNGGGRYIYIMNDDGTGHKNLTPNQSFSHRPTVSPYGLNILYESHFNLWIMDIDGENGINLTSVDNTFYSPSSPTFTPDGNSVVYNRKVKEKGKYNMTHELTKVFIVDIEGNNNVQVSGYGSDYDPFFYDGESLLKDKFIPISE